MHSLNAAGCSTGSLHTIMTDVHVVWSLTQPMRVNYMYMYIAKYTQLITQGNVLVPEVKPRFVNVRGEMGFEALCEESCGGGGSTRWSTKLCMALSSQMKAKRPSFLSQLSGINCYLHHCAVTPHAYQ